MYCTQQDIIDRYGESELIVAADNDGDGEADENIVAKALEDASEEIDTFLAIRYTLPLNPAPAILKRLCVDMALYHMSMPPAITEEKRKRYDDAIKLLTKISEGKVTLGAQDPVEATSSGGAFFQANPTHFTRRRGL
jgi:phage gp36-like protein